VGCSVEEGEMYPLHNLLHRPKPQSARLRDAARRFERLPRENNQLWQADVTYLDIPGHGWWFAVTVIDDDSRYLLALHFTPSYRSADVTTALDLARKEAERIHGPLSTMPTLVTDHGSCFIAKHFKSFTLGKFNHVRIQYRTPTQLGLLERLHQTLKHEEIYWHVCAPPAKARTRLAEYRDLPNIVRPHWALVPETGGDPVTPEDVYVHGVRTTIPKWQPWARAAKRILDDALTASIEEALEAAQRGLPQNHPNRFQRNCEPTQTDPRPPDWTQVVVSSA
jgi:putative transposase